MKKLIYYILAIIIVTIILPAFIVKSCSLTFNNHKQKQVNNNIDSSNPGKNKQDGRYYKATRIIILIPKILAVYICQITK